ncbi:MAG: class I SAM-dependent methyltransferase [Pseudomonadota bacterium]
MTHDGYFDASVAVRYDADHSADDPAEAVRVLAELAGAAPALEFAIGTGRVALPLHSKGVEVHGIELSEAMVNQMRAKPGAKHIPVAIGDMTTTRVEGTFGLVFLVFNTINNLTTQEAQVACFKNAARHLEPGGHFVIQVQVPPLQRLPEGETLLAFAAGEQHFGTDEIEVVTQAFTSHHVWTEGGQTQTLSIPMRYVWPSELDLMARLAGLELVHRWADWKKTPFGPTSRAHVSVWQKPEAATEVGTPFGGQ